MSKAIKLYSRTNLYQLAKRVDGNWFYREWKSNKYGLRWTKWVNIGQLTSIEKVKEPTGCEFFNKYDCLVSNVYAHFDNKWTMKMNFEHKVFKNTLRLPNEK